MRRTILSGLAVACIVGACRDDRAPSRKQASPPRDPTPEAVEDDPPTTFPTPSPEAIARVDAAGKVALDLCRKEEDAVVPGDERTSDGLVAALWMPPATEVVSADETAADQEAYLAAGTFPFVATGAGITIWSEDSLVVTVVGDGSDPCKVTDVAILTERGNPALKFTVVPGTGGHLRGPDQIQEGPGFVRVDHAERGKGATLTAHVCFDDEPTLQIRSVGKHLPVRYFAIGSIRADWCPDTFIMAPTSR